MKSRKNPIVSFCELTVFVFAALQLGACGQSSPVYPTDGKAPQLAYEQGRAVSIELAQGSVLRVNDRRWAEDAKKVEVSQEFGKLYKEYGEFTQIGATICNDLRMPDNTNRYPVRIRCWTEVHNECKDSKIMVVLASETDEWGGADWGVLAFAMQSSLLSPSRC